MDTRTFYGRRQALTVAVVPENPQLSDAENSSDELDLNGESSADEGPESPVAPRAKKRRLGKNTLRVISEDTDGKPGCRPHRCGSSARCFQNT